MMPPPLQCYHQYIQGRIKSQPTVGCFLFHKDVNGSKLHLVIIFRMTNWSTTVYALLPHPNQPLVLAQDASGKIDLPCAFHDAQVWPSDTDLLKSMLEEKIGAPINILCYVARHADPESKRMYIIQLVEPRSEALPSDALWQPVETILQTTAMPAVLRDGLQRWQDEQTCGVVPQRRAPWALPGWYSQVENWIHEQVLLLGRGPVQAIEPIKSWSLSCVLKVITESGLLYFKVARDLPLFVNEGAVLRWLADLYPGRVPLPIAVHPSEGWMLLDDLGDPPEGDIPLAEQMRLVQDFAQFQIDASDQIELLLAAGCKDRRLQVMLSQIESLFNDEIALGPLDADERTKLQQSAPRVRELLTRLTALSIPYSILHGDLHTGNVIPQADSFLYFDWTDAAISHPFFDMIHIFREEEEAKKNALQEAYLRVWEAHFPKDDVHRAWELASVLYGFYHAVSYQSIARGIEEVAWSELNFAYYFLRRLLSGLQRLDAA